MSSRPTIETHGNSRDLCVVIASSFFKDWSPACRAQQCQFRTKHLHQYVEKETPSLKQTLTHVERTPTLKRSMIVLVFFFSLLNNI